MDKVKLLSITSLGMLVANIILIGFLFSHRPPKPHGDNPRKIVIEKLHFDETQIKDYEKLIEEHKSAIRKYEQQMLNIKYTLYATLTTEEKSPSKDSLILEISKLQIAIEHTHYKHFQEIKQLCKPAKKESFEALTLEITDLFPRLKNRQH